jgi:predicted transcriptional regulator
MGLLTGTVVAGKVVVEDGLLVEGASVYIVTREAEHAVRLEPGELAELEAGIAEADRGDMITGDELFARLAKFG